MPAIMDRLVGQLLAKGLPKSEAYAVATKTLQKSGNLKPGTTQATPKGIMRGKMTPAARAKDRAARKSKRKSSAFIYKASNNTAVLKKS